MKIGYPCINRTVDCSANMTFRLKSYSESRLINTVENNLNCLFEILKYNVQNNILFFRITSDLVPFASHPINCFDWAGFFGSEFDKIGSYINANNIRISMHPDQFNVLNSPDEGVFQRSIAELNYHACLLDLMGMDTTAKIQVHVGGVYSAKQASALRFVDRYEKIPESIRRRLVIENDDKQYDLQDCLNISSKTGIPVLFDAFHHQVNCSGESYKEAIEMVAATWKALDGIPMVDYSSQSPGSRKGSHAKSIEINAFRQFLKTTYPNDFDIMLEIKDKEASAIRAVHLAVNDPRFIGIQRGGQISGE